MKTVLAIAVLLQPGTSALADNRTERGKLNGVWVQHGTQGAAGWKIDTVPTGLRLEQTTEGRTIFSFECNTGGRDCNVSLAGRKATVSVYYNGAALVVLETEGDKVLKWRFSMAPSGDTMKVEELALTGSLQPKESYFDRTSAVEAH